MAAETNKTIAKQTAAETMEQRGPAAEEAGVGEAKGGSTTTTTTVITTATTKPPTRAKAVGILLIFPNSFRMQKQ